MDGGRGQTDELLVTSHTLSRYQKKKKKKKKMEDLSPALVDIYISHLPLFSVIRDRRKSVATLGNRLPRRWDKRVEADVMIYISKEIDT